MRDFFNRLKDEKDFRFDLFIGIWSAILIIFIITAIVTAVYFIGIKGEDKPSDDAAIATEAPVATDDPATVTEAPEEKTEDESDESDEEDIIEEESYKGVMYATTTVNVRSKPNTAAASFGKLSTGESIDVYKEMDNGWTKVSFNGKTAYIKSEYLSSYKVSAVTTNAPSSTAKPVVKATKKPAVKATKAPASKATKAPSVTEAPTKAPEPSVTEAPTKAPTAKPQETKAPEEPTNQPDNNITEADAPN